MQEKIEQSNIKYIPTINPRNNKLSPIINLNKENINNIIFYKRILENKDQLEIKNGTDIPKNVINHIINYNYDVLNPNLTYCIDDRTLEKQKKGVYVPGGSDGLLAASLFYLTKLGLEDKISPEEVYSNLLETIGGEDNYYTHSDSHNIKNKGKIGCGHCNVAFNNGSHLLKLHGEYKDFMLNLREQNKNNSKLDILEGEHNPDGVILIDNENSKEKLSIIPKGKDSQFFIYNRYAEKNILKRFIENFNKKENINIIFSEEELDDIAFKAYLSTLEHLGTSDLPHYTVKYNKNSGKYRIKTIGNVGDFIHKHQ